MRKWLAHSLIYLLLVTIISGVVGYAVYTNPAAVRALVQRHLADRFHHVTASVEHARLRLLGGILVHKLRLSRTDGLDRRDFLYVPQAVIYHDKEHLLEGELSVHKLELNQPQIRIVRERDGSLNVDGILTPPDLSQRLPTIVIRDGTILIEDRVTGVVVLEIHGVQLSLVNDPLPTLQIDGSGTADVLGPVRFGGSFTRANRALDLKVELPKIVVGHDLIGRAMHLCPEARHAAELSGWASVSAHIRNNPDASPPLSYEVACKLHDGRFSHKVLPGVLENIELSTRCVNGHFPSTTLTAKIGNAPISATVTDFDFPCDPSSLEPDELGGGMDVTVKNFNITNEALEKLPGSLKGIKKDYSPAGMVNIAYRYRKPSAANRLVREWTIEPLGSSGVCSDFEYPLREVRGRIFIDTSLSPHRHIVVDLTGFAGNSPASLRGHIKGEKQTSEVHLDITAKGVPLDKHIHDPLPPDVQELVKQFLPDDTRKLGLSLRPIGTADIFVELRRRQGKTHIDKHYLLTFKNARAMYDPFPYPVENISGELELHPDHWIARNFRGRHNGGEFWLDGRSQPIEGPGRPKRVHVNIRGSNVLLDREFEQSLVPIGGDDRRGLQKVFRALHMGGRLSFASEVIDQTNQPQAIKIGVEVKGCTLKPSFFNYAMSDVSATVQYANDRVYVTDFKALHKGATLEFDSCLVALGKEGAYTAWLERGSAHELVPDADLACALPESLRRTIGCLNLRAPLAVNLKLTLDAAANNGPTKMWWDGGVTITNSEFRAGVPITNADGRFHCRGHYDGTRLRGVLGELALQRATVFGQPIERVQGRMEVRPDTPDVVRFRDFKANLFGGSVAGEVRLDLVPTFRYDVYLDAMNVQLDRFGKHNMPEQALQAQLSGPARAAVHLTGEGDDLLNLKGNGTVEVRQGKMGQLPILLDLLKAFGLRLPDRTAFEQAQLQFGLEGPRIIVQQLDLYGNAVSLRGQGTCDLDGNNLNLDFTASLGRLNQLLPPVLDIIPETIGQQLYKIKMRGKLSKDGNLAFDQLPVPAVMEPLKRAMRQ